MDEPEPETDEPAPEIRSIWDSPYASRTEGITASIRGDMRSNAADVRTLQETAEPTRSGLQIDFATSQMSMLRDLQRRQREDTERRDAATEAALTIQRQEREQALVDFEEQRQVEDDRFRLGRDAIDNTRHFKRASGRYHSTDAARGRPARRS